MRYRLMAGAAADLAEAARWYNDQREGLGRELIAEFLERVDRALEMPRAGTPTGFTPAGAEIRRYGLKRFSRNAILMATIDEMPTILAVEHSSRRPGYWRGRLH